MSESFRSAPRTDWARYRKWRPSGRKKGSRWLYSRLDASRGASGAAVPPAEETRERDSRVLAANTMIPSRFHVPPRPIGASQSVWGGPPEASILFSLPPAKKPRKRLSGDQKG